MQGATLCADCWHLTTEFSKRHLRKDFAQPGPETCNLCRLLRDSIMAFRDLGDKPELRGADSRLPTQKLMVYHSNRYPMCGVNVTYTRPATATADGRARVYGSEGADVKVVRSAELEITTPPDQNLPWGGFANDLAISNYSGSEECFVRIDEWLEECLKDHQICNERPLGCADTEGPKRLIDTGPLDDDPAPRLIDYPDSGDGKMVKYCALSYCWGREAENFMTTKETYDLRRAGISLEELPWMFRDAVVISRRIGCRYLWVRLASSPFQS